MSMKSFSVQGLFEELRPLFGETPDNMDVQAMLSWSGNYPFPGFPEDEYRLYLSRKDLGFSILFKDAEMVKHPASAGKVPRTPILTGCFFYPGGVEDFETFQGSLPGGILWQEKANELLAKLGEPKNTIMNKKTGLVTAHRWVLGSLLLTAGYRADASSLRDIYVGIV